MRGVTFVFLLLAPCLALHAEPEAYGYPIQNPYVATVIRTPPELQAPLPEEINRRDLELTVFEKRKIPRILWYTKRLEYSLIYQEHKAPLLFVLAGTGSNANDAIMQVLQKAFFQAGFHVISLPSPTHPNFVASASRTSVPGYITEDAHDLYQVMQLAWRQVQNEIEVSDFYLAGYSLGGAQAAFVAKLDEEKAAFNFNKVLMINPPVSLYSSAAILDKLLTENIPGGIKNLDNFINELLAKVTAAYRTIEPVEFDDAFFYQAFQEQQPAETTLAAAIGLVFRWSAANMVFTSDIMTNYGYVKPKNKKLSFTDSLTDYFKVTIHLSLLDYFDEYFFPYFEAREPGLKRQELIHRVSLASIEDYLSTNAKIALVTNADDPILAPGELDYLRQVFKARAKIYPRGGHLGNIEFQENIDTMVNFFLN
jgi:predicted alpha/beta-fold hydrolase